MILQGMLAREIADAIRVKLTPQEEHRFGQGRYVDEEAREARLKGRYYWNKRTEEATGKAIDYFQLAISKDPTMLARTPGLPTPTCRSPSSKRSRKRSRQTKGSRSQRGGDESP